MGGNGIGFTLPGYYTEDQVKKMKEKLTGKTFMNFIIDSTNMAGNHIVTVMSVDEQDVEQLKDMFMFYLVGSL